MPVFELTHPDGRIVEVEAEFEPSQEEAQAVFAQVDAQDKAPEGPARQAPFKGLAQGMVSALAGVAKAAAVGNTLQTMAANRLAGKPVPTSPAQWIEAIKANPMTRATLAMEEKATQAINLTPPERRGWLTKFGETAGAIGPYVALSPIAPAIPAVLAGSSASEHLLSDYDAELAKGKKEDEAAATAFNNAILSGALTGTVFAVLPKPLRKLGEKYIIDKYGKGALSKFLSRRAAGFAEGATLAAPLTVGENAISGQPTTAADLAASMSALGAVGAAFPRKRTAAERNKLAEDLAARASRAKTLLPPSVSQAPAAQPPPAPVVEPAVAPAPEAQPQPGKHPAADVLGAERVAETAKSFLPVDPDAKHDAQVILDRLTLAQQKIWKNQTADTILGLIAKDQVHDVTRRNFEGTLEAVLREQRAAKPPVIEPKPSPPLPEQPAIPPAALPPAGKQRYFIRMSGGKRQVVVEEATPDGKLVFTKMKNSRGEEFEAPFRVVAEFNSFREARDYQSRLEKGEIHAGAQQEAVEVAGGQPPGSAPQVAERGPDEVSAPAQAGEGQVPLTIFDKLYEAIVNGDTTVNGKPEPLLERLKPWVDRGMINSADDIRKIVESDAIDHPPAAERDAMAEEVSPEEAAASSMRERQRREDEAAEAEASTRDIETDIAEVLAEEAEKAGLDVELVDRYPDENPKQPFAGTFMRALGGTRVAVKGRNLYDWVTRDVPLGQEREAIRARLNEEWLHNRVIETVGAEGAAKYWNSLTKLEQSINIRRYSGFWGAQGLSESQLGHEALRFQLQRAARMTPSEYAETVGREKMTLRALTALEDIVRKLRTVAGTSASKEQMAILDRMYANITLARSGTTPTGDQRAVAVGNAVIGEAGPYAIRRLYHGNMHGKLFDKFDLRYVNTGEGTTVEGWGLYFTETRAVAEWYRDANGWLAVIVDGRRLVLPNAMQEALEKNPIEQTAMLRVRELIWLLQEYAARGKESAINYAKYRSDPQYASDPDFWKLAERWVRSLKEPPKLSAAGSLYEVDADIDNQRIARWRDPIRHQPEKVRNVMLDSIKEFPDFKHWPNLHGPFEDFYKALDAALARKYPGALDENVGRLASQYLREKGIQGVRYEDGDTMTSPIPKGMPYLNGKPVNTQVPSDVAGLSKPEIAAIEAYEANNGNVDDALIGLRGTLFGKDLKKASAFLNSGKLSMSSGRETYNYVLFDDKLVKIRGREGPVDDVTDFLDKQRQQMLWPEARRRKGYEVGQLMMGTPEPVPPKAAPGAAEMGALPGLSLADVRAGADKIVAGEASYKQVPLEKVERALQGTATELKTTAPDFSEFREWVKNNAPATSEENIRNTWMESVWDHVTKADGKRLVDLVKALNLEGKVGTITEADRAKVEDALNAARPGGAKAAPGLGSGNFFELLGLASGEGAKVDTKKWSKIVSEISFKLTSKAVQPIDVRRAAIGIEDLDFENPNTKMGAYHEFSSLESSLDRVLPFLRDEARTKGRPESETKRVLILLDKNTGEVHALSTYNDAGVQRIMPPGAGAHSKNMPLEPALFERYRPAAVLLLRERIQNLAQKWNNWKSFEDSIGARAKHAELLRRLPPNVEGGEDVEFIPSARTGNRPLTEPEVLALHDVLQERYGDTPNIDKVQEWLMGLPARTLTALHLSANPTTTLAEIRAAGISPKEWMALNAIAKIGESHLWRMGEDGTEGLALQRAIADVSMNMLVADGDRYLFTADIMSRLGPRPLPPSVQAVPGTSRDLQYPDLPYDRVPPTTLREPPPPRGEGMQSADPYERWLATFSRALPRPVPQGELPRTEPGMLTPEEVAYVEKLAAEAHPYKASTPGEPKILELPSGQTYTLDASEYTSTGERGPRRGRSPRAEAQARMYQRWLADRAPFNQDRPDRPAPFKLQYESWKKDAPQAVRRAQAAARDTWDQLGIALKSAASGHRMKEEIYLQRDVADNMPVITARQSAETVRLASHREMPANLKGRVARWRWLENEKKRAKLLRAAAKAVFATAEIQYYRGAHGRLVPVWSPNRANLDKLRGLVRSGAAHARQFAQSGDIVKRWQGRRWLRATELLMQEIDNADKYWSDPQLRDIVKAVRKELRDQRDFEVKNGMDVAFERNYLPGRYDAEVWSPEVLKFGGHPVLGRNFRRPKHFAHYYEAIASDPYIPKNYDTADLVEHRVRQGQRAIAKNKWTTMLTGMVDPTDNEPIALEPRMASKLPYLLVNPITGKLNPPVKPKSNYAEPPRGYRTLVLDGGRRTLYVKEEYVNTVKNMAGESAIAEHPVLGNALRFSQWLKHHAILVYDTFHPARLAQYYASIVLPARSWGEGGWSALEYRPQDLAEAVRKGFVSEAAAAWADMPVELTAGGQRITTTRRELLKGAVRRGLNVGRLQDALYMELGHMLPGVLRLNRFVFNKMTRGFMAEAAVREIEKYNKRYPNTPLDTLVRDVVRDTNVFFGSLGRQGFFKNPTVRDFLMMFYLAPQWVEGLVQKELRAAGRTANLFGRAVGVDVTRKGLPPLGTVGGGLWKGLLTYALITQAINLYTRGHPTWMNEEEGHKWDAYIPYGDRGFWLSPMSVFAEFMHDVLRLWETKPTFWDAIDQINRNKLGPLGRAGTVAITKKTPMGEFIPTTGGRVGAVAGQFFPMPITLTPVVQALASQFPQGQHLPLVGGAFEKPYPGSLARQFTASLGGIKMQAGDSAVQQVSRKATHWMRKADKYFETEQRDPTTGESYTKLRTELITEDWTAARRMVKLLMKHRTIDQINQSMVNWSRRPFTGSEMNEAEFYSSLNTAEQELYNRAIEEKALIMERYVSLLLTKLTPEELGE